MKKSIEQIDREIQRLICERLDALKRQSNDDPEFTLIEHLSATESVIVESNSDQPNEVDSVTAKDTLSHIFSNIAMACWQEICRAEQVAFLGPKYSFSYNAALKRFASDGALVAVQSIAAVFDSVRRNQARWGVVPIENSTDGRIVDTLTNFSSQEHADSDVKICGEITTPIRHCLLSTNVRENIRIVYSKPQAISQCRGWLAANLANVEFREVSSTTVAAQKAAAEPTAAAIASREAGMHYGLNMIAEGIEDNHRNETRFAIIGKSTPSSTGSDKTTLLIRLPHQSGTLATAMNIFQTANLNLTWIESFPIPGSDKEYLFFIELDGHVNDDSVTSAINELSTLSVELHHLGSYPKTK